MAKDWGVEPETDSWGGWDKIPSIPAGPLDGFYGPHHDEEGYAYIFPVGGGALKSRERLSPGQSYSPHDLDWEDWPYAEACAACDFVDPRIVASLED
jgi:hypothetical protein